MEKENFIDRCQRKLDYFRIKELKDVLSRLGIAKQGKKQVLLERILAVLSAEQGSRSQGWPSKYVSSKEEVAKIIDDIYRKMQGSAAPDLAPRSRSTFNSRDIVQEHVKEINVCCPCGISMQNEFLIQCDESRCGVWQHQRCVIIPDGAEGSQTERPSSFFCGICRVNRGDPFCSTMAQPLLQTKLSTSPMSVDGTNRILTLDKTFELRRPEIELLQRTGYELQVWCVLLNDKVPFRIHWPQYSDLRVNGLGVRATNRQGTQFLGLKARDDGPIISTCKKEGTNRISLQAQDSRPFALGVRIIRRRSFQEVRSLIPSESEGESFEVSVNRVRQCIGGDDDGELQVVAESETVNLRCPLSGSRIKIAGRFKPCSHMGCFDLDTLIEFNQVARKWQCPTCMENYTIRDIIIDRYFNRIVTCLQNYPEDVTEVEVKPDAAWRPKLEGEGAKTEKWRSSDGSVITNGHVNSQIEKLNNIKEEIASEGHLAPKIRMKRNSEGLWEVRGPTSYHQNVIEGTNDINNSKAMPTTTSATASNRDDEDPSVNQEGSNGVDFSGNFERFNSPSLGYNHLPQVRENLVTSGSSKAPEVIVLDSDEENADDVNICSSNVSAFVDTPGHGPSVLSPETLQEMPVGGNGIQTFIPPISGTREVPFSEIIPPDSNTIPPVGYFMNDNSSINDFNFSSWHSNAQNTELRLFGQNTDISGRPQSEAFPCQVPFNDFGLSASQQPEHGAVGSLIPDYGPSLGSSMSTFNVEANGCLDNHASVDDENSPLQCFLPLHPSRSSIQTDYRDQLNTCEDLQSEWTSLRLGSSHNNLLKTCSGKSTTPVHNQQSAQDKDDLATASVLLNMSENRADPCSGDEAASESPIINHQRPRSVRPRLCLPIESDSD